MTATTATTDTAAALLADLAARGIELTVRDGRLRFRPAAKMTPELLERLKAHKGELLAVLAASSPRMPVGGLGRDRANDSPPGGGSAGRLPEADIPPRPADRPGFVTELRHAGGGWTWRQRRADAADRAWLAYREGESILTRLAKGN